ncbi:MAG: anti-sigma factor [Acidobacteriota bacterium]|nr:anti-sigma factor [Acidobacteriota bacterium]MDW3229761.1 anti-sigma factor [Acidobacteriota bacterium]MDY0232004.1 anti-sigma factor [Candidatus Saccharicenans sp.]
MRCKKAQELINRLLDQELTEKDHQKLQAHLDRCDQCRQVYGDLKAIKTRIISADSLEPSDKIWENLKIRIQSEIIPELSAKQPAQELKEQEKNRSRRFQLSAPAYKYVTAAFILLVFIAGAFYFGRYYQKPAQPGLEVASENPALQKLQEAEFYYQKAIESLTQAVQSSNDELPPQMVEVLQANLRLLDGTIELYRQVINKQPSNLLAREYLLGAYEAKVNFLNTMLETKESLAASSRHDQL